MRCVQQNESERGSSLWELNFCEFRLTPTLLEQPLPQLDLKETQGTRYIEEIFYDVGGETLEQVAQRGGECPIPGNIQGRVGQDSEQLDLLVDVPAHCRGVGLDDL